MIWRRRLYYWRRKYRLVRWILVLLAISVAISIAINSITGGDTSIWGALGAIGDFLARTLPGDVGLPADPRRSCSSSTS